MGAWQVTDSFLTIVRRGCVQKGLTPEQIKDQCANLDLELVAAGKRVPVYKQIALLAALLGIDEDLLLSLVLRDCVGDDVKALIDGDLPDTLTREEQMCERLGRLEAWVDFWPEKKRRRVFQIWKESLKLLENKERHQQS